MPTSASRTARDRVRAELTREIKDSARRQLAAEGAASISLRAVARELGMASSALYRYFASRDDLLTALIVDAYNALGDAAEAAEAACATDDFLGRWMALAVAVRTWALTHPHEYALVYGSPVPGYKAPEATIGPAARAVLRFSAVITEAYAAGALVPIPDGPSISKQARDEARRLEATAMPGVPAEIALRALALWAQLFGLVSLELFGQFVNVLEDTGAVFTQLMLTAAGSVGLTPQA